MGDQYSGTEKAANRIAVLLLNWQDINNTVKSVKSVAESVNVTPEVFLLDNGTEATAFSRLKKQLEEVNIKVHFFASIQNLGFAGGVNYLLDKIDLEKFSAIFLLNNDANVTPIMLDVLLKESKSKGTPMLGPKNRFVESHISKSWPWWLFGLRISQGYDQDKKMWPTCSINGSALFINVQLVQKIIDQRDSLLKYSYYLYGEDTELGLYALEMDIQPYITTKATYFHRTGFYKTESRRMLTYYYTTRNRLYLCRDYLHGLLKPLFHIYYVLSRLLIIFYRLLRRENSLAVAIAEGLRDGYLGKGGKWIKHT